MNLISHSLPTHYTNYYTHDLQSYVYIELFLPMYLLPILLLLIQYLTLVFMWTSIYLGIQDHQSLLQPSEIFQKLLELFSTLYKAYSSISCNP